MWVNIQRLHLKNYQCISEHVTLEMAPITFLYGPNSAGKSAIYDALKLAASICNGKVSSEDLNAAVHVGSEGVAREMMVGLGMKTSSWSRFYTPSYIPESSDPFDFCPELTSLIHIGGDELFDIDVLFTYATAGKRSANLTQVTIRESGKPVVVVDTQAETISVSRRSNVFSEVNRCLSEDDVATSFEELCDESLVSNSFSMDGDWVRIKGYISNDGTTISDNIWNSLEGGAPVLSTQDVFGKQKWFLVVMQFLVLGPIRSLGEVAERGPRIGPIRKIPDEGDLLYFLRSERNGLSVYRSYSGDRSSWFDGSIAWANLCENKEVVVRDEDGNRKERTESLLDAVNEWIGADAFLGMGYSVRREMMSVAASPESDNPTEVEEEKYRGRLVPKYMSRLYLVSTHNNADLRVNQVGSGVAQVVPILVAGFTAHQYFVEQPELHLHPKLQAQLTDFFISRWANYRVRVVLETHSEYLALRALRRIRETSYSNIRHREFTLGPGDVAFYYFDNIGGTTNITRLRVTNDGEFVDRWPKGFFAERERELFDEYD